MKRSKILMICTFVFALSAAFAFKDKGLSFKFQTTGYGADGNTCVSGPIDNSKDCNTSAGTQCTFMYGINQHADAHASCTAGTPPTLGLLLKYQ